jgi:hypothetical protein
MYEARTHGSVRGIKTGKRFYPARFFFKCKGLSYPKNLFVSLHFFKAAQNVNESKSIRTF